MAFDVNPERTAHVVAHLALKSGRRAIARDLAPMLVYLADRESIMHHGHPIGDALHRVMDGVAVQSPCDDIVTGRAPTYPAWDAVLRFDGPDVVLHDHVVDADLDHLSIATAWCIDQVAERFAGWTAKNVREWMTEPDALPELADRTGGIPLAEIMRAVGLHDPEGQARHEESMRDVGLVLDGHRWSD